MKIRSVHDTGMQPVRRAVRSFARSLGAAGGFLGGALVLLASCSAYESAELVGQTEDMLASGSVAGSFECELPQVAQSLSLEIDATSSTAPVLILTNFKDKDATVSIVGTSFGDRQRIHTSPLTARLAPLARTVVSIPFAQLQLAERDALAGGKLTFSATAIYSDGLRESVSSPSAYYTTQGIRRLSLTPNVTTSDLRGAYRDLLAKEPNRALDVPLLAAPEAPDGSSSIGAAPIESGTRRTQPGEVGILSTVSRKLCIKLVVTHTDGGIGEDSWTSVTATQRPALGNNVNVAGTSYTLDSSGCVTGTFTVGNNLISIYAQGQAANHWVDVEPVGGSTAGIQGWYNISSSTSTLTIVLDPTGTAAEDDFNIYLPAALAVRSHGGLGTSDLFLRPNATSTSYSGGEVSITLADSKNKFTIGHEVGHFVVFDSTDIINSDYSMTGTDVDCKSSGTNSTLFSVEYQSAAFNQGFADFYSADIFNSHSESDCKYKIAGTELDCENGSTGLPIRQMETNCENDEGGTDWQGMGNETDWMRTMWDVHTNGATYPSMNDMLSWVKTANDTNAWSRSNIYQRLDSRANTIGGSLNTNWDGAKGGTGNQNGIDHP